ncbi:MAG: hypothetical protein RIR11_2788 [Bacteroidota bacterium]|jgi:hypothetical protein
MNLEIDLSTPNITDEELLAVLTVRIENMLEQETDMLLSLLYRLDVEEKAILKALQPEIGETAASSLAKLVLKRQKQRWEIKKSTEVDHNDIPKGWEW